MKLPSFIDRLKRDVATQLILLGILVGVCSGLAAVLFRWAIEGVRIVSFGDGANVFTALQLSGWVRRLTMPALGGLLVGLLVKFFMKDPGAHGIPEVMEAVQLHGGKLPKRIILLKTLTSALTIGSGGSTGREGPIAHIGSAIGSAFSQLFKMKGELSKTMIGCGAAGGIAATFNAPIAGALFALEIIHGDVEIRHFTPVVISSVMATVISNSLLKEVTNFPVLSSEQFIFQLKSGQEIFLYMLMAILIGVISILLIKTLEKTEHQFQKLPVPHFSKPAMGGLLMGTIAIFFPQIHGLANYSTINAILEGQYLWYTIAALAFIKILATSLTLGSGGSGGIFAPCLFIGAMIGHTFGYGAHALLPHITASAGSYALVGMGALMAGVTQAPLTAVVLIFELTGKYTIILPLLVTCAISTILVQIILKGSVFTRVLAKKGIVYGERRNVLRRMKVREILRKTFVSVSPEMHYKKLLDTFTHSKQYSYPVLDSEKKLVGIISLQDFQELVLENSLADVLVVGELMTQNVITVTPNETLEEALLKIGDRNIEYLPVLESAQSKKCIGIVSRRDILSRYNQEVRELRTRAAT